MSINNRFFEKKITKISVFDIAKLVGGVAIGKNQSNFESASIEDVGSIFHIANHEEVKNKIYFSNGKDLDLIAKVKFCIIGEQFKDLIQDDQVFILHKNPQFAWAVLLNEFYSERLSLVQNTQVHSTAKIGKNTIVMNGAFIGENVVIGDNCYIGGNSVLDVGCIVGDNTRIMNLVAISHTEIGKNCIIHNGAKIGQDGFGYVFDNGGFYKIPQLGFVLIEDGVEIGANTCIDRAAFFMTKIGCGTKIDNLIQIGHNCMIGRNCTISGMAGVAGSVNIGDFVQMGGGAKISDHIKIGNGAKIAGGAGVIKNVNDGEVVGGFPAVSIRRWHKQNIFIDKIASLNIKAFENLFKKTSENE